MGSFPVKLFKIWTSGSGVDVILRKSLLRGRWTDHTCQTKTDNNKKQEGHSGPESP